MMKELGELTINEIKAVCVEYECCFGIDYECPFHYNDASGAGSCKARDMVNSGDNPEDWIPEAL